MSKKDAGMGLRIFIFTFYHPYFVCILFHHPYIVHVMLIYFGYENSLKTPDNHRHLQVKVVDMWVLGGAATSQDPPLVSPSDTCPHAVRRIPWTSRDPPLLCPLRQRPPCCPEDPLHILRSSPGVFSDTGCLQDIPIIMTWYH